MSRCLNDGRLIPVPYMVAFFFVFIVIEALLIIRKNGYYPVRETLRSLAITVVFFGCLYIAPLITLDISGLLYRRRLFTIDACSVPMFIVLFLLVDFLYYWYHRASHRFRAFWLIHSVHHAPNVLNFAVSFQQSWVGPFFSGIFIIYVPLVLVGFDPALVFCCYNLNLAYQFLIHTEVVDDLGIFESVLNTPKHHRLHHSSDESDRSGNYGGVFIICDRIFGTLKTRSEKKKIVYGISYLPEHSSPPEIVFLEWKRLLNDLKTGNK